MDRNGKRSLGDVRRTDGAPTTSTDASDQIGGSRTGAQTTCPGKERKEMNRHTALYTSVCAGSPSPIDDSEAFDLAAHLITHPCDTFYVRVSGDSMINAGIFDGDILVVDRAVEPHASDIVVA